MTCFEPIPCPFMPMEEILMVREDESKEGAEATENGAAYV